MLVFHSILITFVGYSQEIPEFTQNIYNYEQVQFYELGR